VLPANILAKADRMIVWWTPARRRQMFYKNSEGKAAELNGRIIRNLHWSGGLEWELNIRAIPENKRQIDNETCRRALLESFGRWRVCTGTMRCPDSASVASIPAWERGFYESAFSTLTLVV